MTSKPKIPEDLGVKIGSPKEAIWTRVKDEAKQQISQGEINLIIQKEVLRLAEEMIKKEQLKSQS